MWCGDRRPLPCLFGGTEVLLLPDFSFYRTARVAGKVVAAAVGALNWLRTSRFVGVRLSAPEADWMVFVGAMGSDVVFIRLTVVAAQEPSRRSVWFDVESCILIVE